MSRRLFIGPGPTLFLCWLALVGVVGGIPAQENGGSDQDGLIDLDQARAEDEFRWGVEAFHAGRLNDAIFGFSRALAFKPDDFRSREWLGRAYVRSGFPSAGLTEWQSVVEAGEAPGYLLSQIETLEYQRGLVDRSPRFDRYVLAESFAGRRGEIRLFRRPAGILPMPDGTFYVVSMATQDVVLFNPNGTVLRRLRGGVVGLETPYDVARLPDGNIVVSEYGADRLTIMNARGDVVRRFGGTGLAPGQLLGPQYLATDNQGFIYVSEWGARRVSKFNDRGEFVAAFGRATPAFSGLNRPTGITIIEGTVFVADRREDGTVLETFDLSGNWIETIPIPLRQGEETSSLEDVQATDAGTLIIVTGDETILFDAEQQSVLARVEGEDSDRLVSASVDANGRILASDFDGDRIALFEPTDNLYSGLEVRIQRIVSRSFPEMGVEVRVTNRAGDPIVGLDQTNFRISERGRLIDEIELQSATHAVESLDLSIVVDVRSSVNGADARGGAVRALQDVLTRVNQDDRVRVYLVGPQPQELDIVGQTEAVMASRFEQAVDRLYSGVRSPGSIHTLDRTIRLGAAARVSGDVRRAVILITDGYVSDADFEDHSLEELEAFMTANGIRFGVVNTSDAPPPSSLQFLADNTRGVTVQAFAPAGVIPVFEHLRTVPGGLYWLRYQSVTEPEFVSAFVTTSVETNLFTRSGRDELGYFAPARGE